MTNQSGAIQRGYRKLRYEWRASGPVVTWAIVVICVAMWLVEIFCRYAAPRQFANIIYSGSFIPGLAIVKPWTWFTSMFLHDPNVLHVLCNMLTLVAIGPYLEGLLGHWNFLALYLICGLGGSDGLMVYSAVTQNWAISAYGASDALFGLFGALLLVFRRTHTDIRAMLACVAINFAMPLFVPRVAWQSHVGGFVVGIVLTWLLLDGVPALRRRPLWARMLVYGAIVVVLLVILAVVLTPAWVLRFGR
ncbi:rhomboid family intramembrane serine protease [Bifidobacterium sp. ESL0775]|uniref:rhomboid family intramembrane serine protease n=1 Tax=Bifidobacterium sp. ESL0775 TaxID=2983230 RepID=UPI0023F8ADC8|nr:rhomboid family intramembrane serine protease [Bifidobacterium sp. ESL0775]WEV69368.1 rhomboid family intramembrane serine protease [Bifidobacterium sp. ESL0775]